MTKATLSDLINEAIKHHPFCEHVKALAEHAENLERQVEQGLVDGIYWREQYAKLLRVVQENSERMKAVLMETSK